MERQIEEASVAQAMSQRFLVAVVFIIERDGQVLLLRRAASKDHAPGEWEPGSGRVQAGEEPADAVVREAREETSLDVEILGPIDTFHYYRGPARDEAIGIVFHCLAVGGSLRLSAEHDAARWVSVEGLAEADVSTAFCRSLALVAQRRRELRAAGEGDPGGDCADSGSSARTP